MLECAKGVNNVTGATNSGADSEQKDEVFLRVVGQSNSRDEPFITLKLNNQTPVQSIVQIGHWGSGKYTSY